MAADTLEEYRNKRNFEVTSEPAGKTTRKRKSNLKFLVQKHAARRLHYDFRLEWNGVLLSWAVTRGPSDDPGEKRLAVRTEDHPLSYGNFEGTIPKGEYGGGTVMLWDSGTWQPIDDPDAGLKQGKLHFILQGERMHGEWVLVLMRGKSQGKRQNWLLIKHRDRFASEVPEALTHDFTTSVQTGRSMDSIAASKKNNLADTQKKPDVKKPEMKKSEKPAGRKKAKTKSRTGKTDLMPPFQKPQLATLVTEVPEGNKWLHETKFDGYRCLTSVGDKEVALYTRSGLDWSEKFSSLKEPLLELPCKSALLDGEVLADVTGAASGFSALQRALKEGGPLLYYLFDLLSLNGTDLRELPLHQRKRRLQKLLKKCQSGSAIRYTEDIRGQGQVVLNKICRAGGEGVVSKRIASAYRGKRNRDWLKTKCTRRQEFVIGGYSPSDKQGRAFASLLVGTYEHGKLIYRGRIGTGFTGDDLQILSALFQHNSRKTSPFLKVPSAIARTARWVSPLIVAEVDFSELTDDGHIRHGVYMGHRKDKKADEIRMDKPVSLHKTEKQKHTEQNRKKGKEKRKAEMDGKTAKKQSVTAKSDRKVASVNISSGSREVFPGAGVTKLDLARYYESAADRLIAIAGKRPLSFVRCPQGISGDCFYQKHAGKSFPSDVKTLDITEKKGGSRQYMYVSSASGVVAAVQMGVIEFHMWGCKTDRIERPDRLVFDLDPDVGLDFIQVREAAFMLRKLLGNLGLDSVPVLTGGKGVHVCVCLRRTVSWDTLKTFSKIVATFLSQRHPDLFTATASKEKRTGRIFIDWMRNQRGATAVSPYVVRARSGAPVAMPVTWRELKRVDSANMFTVKAVHKRLKKACPYLAALEALQTLSQEVFKALEEQTGN